MDQFKDKVAIVTGGASGMGRALCEELGRRGAVVIAADINSEGIEEAASAISAGGGRVRGFQLDVTRANDVKELISGTASEHGRLDYMFNNAGVVIIGEARDLKPEDWYHHIEVNLVGVLNGTIPAYSLMVMQGFGHIVNTASLAGIIITSGIVPYATTKHGVVGLSTSLRAEGAGLGVKVSVVCPGFVRTGMFEAPLVKADREDLLAKIPKKAIWDTQKAARSILNGVAKNKQFITFPFYVKLFWWLYRLSPSLAAAYARKEIRDFRAIRK